MKMKIVRTSYTGVRGKEIYSSDLVWSPMWGFIYLDNPIERLTRREAEYILSQKGCSADEARAIMEDTPAAEYETTESHRLERRA